MRVVAPRYATPTGEDSPAVPAEVKLCCSVPRNP